MDAKQQFQLATDQDFLHRTQSVQTVAAANVRAETQNDVQTLAVAGTGGTFTLTIGTLGTTAAIAFNATALTVQNAITALAGVGAGNVQCTGGPLTGTNVVINFIGTLGNLPQALITVGTNSVTGGAGPTITHTQVGIGVVNHAARDAAAKLMITQPQTYVPNFAQVLATNSTIQGDFDPVTLKPRNSAPGQSPPPANAGGITAVTNANPAQVTWPAHGLASGAQVDIVNAQGATGINGTGWYITVVDVNNFTLFSDAARTIGVAAGGAYTANTGNAAVSELQIKGDMQFQANSQFNDFI